jgi:hypothetical protein
MNARGHQLDEFVAFISYRFGEVAIFGGNVWGLYDCGFHSITLYSNGKYPVTGVVSSLSF